MHRCFEICNFIIGLKIFRQIKKYRIIQLYSNLTKSDKRSEQFLPRNTPSPFLLALTCAVKPPSPFSCSYSASGWLRSLNSPKFFLQAFLELSSNFHLHIADFILKSSMCNRSLKNSVSPAWFYASIKLRWFKTAVNLENSSHVKLVLFCSSLLVNFLSLRLIANRLLILSALRFEWFCDKIDFWNWRRYLCMLCLSSALVFDVSCSMYVLIQIYLKPVNFSNLNPRTFIQIQGFLHNFPKLFCILPLPTFWSHDEQILYS